MLPTTASAPGRDAEGENGAGFLVNGIATAGLSIAAAVWPVPAVTAAAALNRRGRRKDEKQESCALGVGDTVGGVPWLTLRLFLALLRCESAPASSSCFLPRASAARPSRPLDLPFFCAAAAAAAFRSLISCSCSLSDALGAWCCWARGSPPAIGRWRRSTLREVTQQRQRRWRASTGGSTLFFGADHQRAAAARAGTRLWLVDSERASEPRAGSFFVVGCWAGVFFFVCWSELGRWELPENVPQHALRNTQGLGKARTAAGVGQMRRAVARGRTFGQASRVGRRRGWWSLARRRRGEANGEAHLSVVRWISAHVGAAARVCAGRSIGSLPRGPCNCFRTLTEGTCRCCRMGAAARDLLVSRRGLRVVCVSFSWQRLSGKSLAAYEY